MKKQKPNIPNSNVIFEYDNVSSSDRLETFAKEKLKTIFSHFDFVSRANIFFKTENTSSDETGMKCGIRLSAPGLRLFAEASRSNFENAISESVDELVKQLKKRKDKMKTY